MTFKKDKYVVIKNILSKDIVNIAHNYIMRKKKLYDFLIDKIISLDDFSTRLGFIIFI